MFTYPVHLAYGAERKSDGNVDRKRKDKQLEMVGEKKEPGKRKLIE